MAEPLPAPDKRFPCPACGADLRFQPGEGRLFCDHCGHTEPLTHARPTGGAISETAFRRGIEDQLPATETEDPHLSHCPNCGADVQFDPAVHATECPFCATPVVADPGLTRRIRPKGVAPFLIAEEQARKVLENLGATLGAAGLTLDDVVKTTIFLKDMEQFAAVNEVYGEFFSEPYPARSTVEVARLPKDVHVEIEAIAHRG